LISQPAKVAAPAAFTYSFNNHHTFKDTTERIIRSVANLTRKAGVGFLELEPQIPVKIETQLFKLQQANEALEALRKGKIQRAAVLVMS